MWLLPKFLRFTLIVSYSLGDQIVHIRRMKGLFDVIDDSDGMFAAVPHRMQVRGTSCRCIAAGVILCVPTGRSKVLVCAVVAATSSIIDFCTAPFMSVVYAPCPFVALGLI